MGARLHKIAGRVKGFVAKRWRRRSRITRLLAVVLGVALLATLASVALGQSNPLNDLFALGQGSGDSPSPAAVQKPAAPSYDATPVVPCASGSRPEPGVDGRVPADSLKDGLNCNVSLVGRQGTEGGFKVFRYVDRAGHVCAFYDTTLLFPTNIVNPGGGSHGVAVLDMSDPAHPKQTDSLNTVPMISPHESLNLNERRGLLAAVNGNPTTYPGFVSFYDASQDCRHPQLQADGPYARFGHESGFSSDGKTFYATSTALQAITAIDVTDPKSPHAVWQGNVFSHGMSLSDDGNRAYIADPKGNMLILDTSQIQARKPNPQAREISRLTWDRASIPQNAIPFTENGHPYVLEFDEYTQQTLNPNGDPNQVGAARIVDIADETKPVVVANIRLAIDNPAEHKAAVDAGDPGTRSPAQGYAAHYCNIPTRVDPKVVACSFIASGLRVFDISDLVHPKEIAYYVAPSKEDTQNGYDGSNYAMSQPAFAPGRQIWYSDGSSGFYALRVDASVWPGATARSGACTARTRSRHLRVRRHGVKRIRVTGTKGRRPVRGAVVRVRGAGVKRHARTNRRGQVTFRLRPRRSGRVTVSSRGCGQKLRVRSVRVRSSVRGGRRTPAFAGSA